VGNIGSVHLGGAKIGLNNCGPGFDYTCTFNWRLESDQYGCPTWNYDFDGICCPLGQPDGAVYHSDACPAGSDADSGHDAPSGN